MYRLFLTLLVTWGFMVGGAQAQGDPPETCKFDKMNYTKTLNLTSLNGDWYHIRSTLNLPCTNTTSLLSIDGTKNTIKFPAEVKKNETGSNAFTEDKGVLKITVKKPDGTQTELKAVLLPSTLDPNYFILSTCEVVNKTEVVSARYFSKTKDYKLEDAQKVVDGLKVDLAGLKWNWTNAYCSAASMAHISYVITIFAALFVSKM